MLHRRLAMVLTIGYYHMLIFALMPTKLQMGHGWRLSVPRPSMGYLFYSVCLTGLLMLQFPRMLPRVFGEYMRNNIVLQWSLIVNVILRTYAFLSCYGLVWLQRGRLRKLCKDFVGHWRAHWPVLRRVAGQPAMEQLQLKMAGMLIRKLCISYVLFCSSFVIQYRLDNQENPLQFVARGFQMMMISVVRVGFYTLLVLLSHQFDAVQLSLQALHKRVAVTRSLEDVRRLAVIHASWMQLARRAFRLCDVANASIFVNMFSLNINILYHAVQFTNRTIEANTLDNLFGESLVICSLAIAVMLMNMVDYTLSSCNNAGQLLRQFNDLRRFSPESQLEVRLLLLQGIL